jgi:hypothetical protein
MKKTIHARINDHTAIYFTRKMNESHKTESDLLRHMIETYREFEAAGYLNADGSKIKELETRIQLEQKLRDVQAEKLQNKIDFEKEMTQIKEERKKQADRDRAVRNQPKVDWKEAAGTEAVSYGDGYFG